MRTLLFCDSRGARRLLEHIPPGCVIGIVGASIRPQYLIDLQSLAANLNVSFYIQPKRSSAAFPQFLDQVKALQPDLIFIHSYSMMLSDAITAVPSVTSINLHESLLPRNRGPNPIQWSIIKGDTVTGVSLHEVSTGADSGPIIDQEPVPITHIDTWQSLAAKLDLAVHRVLTRTVPLILDNRFTSFAQDEEQASHNIRRAAKDSEFAWNQSVISIYRLARAVQEPLPSAFVHHGNSKRLELPSSPGIQDLMRMQYFALPGLRNIHADALSSTILIRPKAALLPDSPSAVMQDLIQREKGRLDSSSVARSVSDAAQHLSFEVLSLIGEFRPFTLCACADWLSRSAIWIDASASESVAPATRRFQARQLLKRYLKADLELEIADESLE